MPARKERELALQAPDKAGTTGGRALSPPRHKWWREIVTIAVFYELYSLARNTQGSGSTSDTHAFRNARVVIKIERALGLYHEETIQRLFLNARPLVVALNVYYGTAHFLVTAGILMWLFVRHPDRYGRWRWALACTTLLALVGFLAFPLMPPRLITSKFATGSYQDTLHTIGGLWNFEDGAIAKLSNQYAAMPSLHFAWSLWCCLALWPRLRSPWARALAVAHPVITLVAIVATANHYWLDAAGGAVALLVGWLVGRVMGSWGGDGVDRWSRLPGRRRAASPLRPAEPEAHEPGGPSEGDAHVAQVAQAAPAVQDLDRRARADDRLPRDPAMRHPGPYGRTGRNGRPVILPSGPATPDDVGDGPVPEPDPDRLGGQAAPAPP